MRVTRRASPVLSVVWIAVIVIGLMPSSASGGWLEAAFAPKAELWQRWTAHDPAATGQIEHGRWDNLLRIYLSTGEDGVNRFAYGRVTAEDRQSLDRYIDALTATAISRFNRRDQLAYWINLYNALTVVVVLDHYPVNSIQDIDISPGLFASGPWDKKLIEVEGEMLSLNDIEHRILRPIWRDPRIHYAVNCAAIGCPNLRMTAFTSENADDLLTEGAREYVNHPRGARLENARLIVSSIYVWFKGDFGKSNLDVIEHLKRYADPELATALDGIDLIDDDSYDWALNDGPGS